MSAQAVHLSRRSRKCCESCRKRKARFQHRGVVRADRHHTLCFECFRAQRDRRRAQQLADARSPQGAPRLPFGDAAAEVRPAAPLEPRGALNDRQREHRRRMLAHLAAAQLGVSGRRFR